MDYAHQLQADLRASFVRTEIDDSKEGLGKKIRNAELRKIPYMPVVGEKEVETKQVAVRNYRTKTQNTMPAETFIAGVLKEIQSRQLEAGLLSFYVEQAPIRFRIGA